MMRKIWAFLMILVLCIGMVYSPVTASERTEQISVETEYDWLESLLQLYDEKTVISTQDNLEITFSTDEVVYADKDIVELSVSVWNSNEAEVENLSVDWMLPYGYRLVGEPEEWGVDALPVGRSITMKVECVPSILPSAKVLGMALCGALVVVSIIGGVWLKCRKKHKFLMILPILSLIIACAGAGYGLYEMYLKGGQQETATLSRVVTAGEKEFTFEAKVKYDEIEIEPDTVLVSYVMFFGDDFIENAERYYDFRMEKGELLKEPKTPKTDVAEFAGWYTTSDYMEEFDFSTPVTEDVVLFAKWNLIETDTDGDGLFDVVEKHIGSSVDDMDTDDDGLNDYEEVAIGTNPGKADSDSDGINDFEDDVDGDMLSNGYEVALGTDAGRSDTDLDGLNDYEELEKYGTDPLSSDTDGDGGKDAWEIYASYDPLVYNKVFQVKNKAGELDGNVKVTAEVELEMKGEQIATLDIKEVNYGDNHLVRATLPGYMGEAYDFTVQGEFSSATLTFSYDTSVFGVPDEDFQPRIYYINEETGNYEELENQIVEDGRVIAKTPHFSTYILLNKVEFDAIWEKSIRAPEEVGLTPKVGMDMVLLIDYSLSMPENDPNDLRKDAAKLFLDKLGKNDRATVVPFSGGVGTYGELTNDIETLKDKIDNTELTYGTDFSSPVSTAINILSKEGDDRYKYIVLLTDGQGTYSTDYSRQAKEAGMSIFTIGLGDDISFDVLKTMAKDTNGSFFHVSSASGLFDVFEETAKATIDFITDSNQDGISDYYAQLIFEGNMPLADRYRGIDFSQSDDWDGDGLKNGEEIQIVHENDMVYIKTDSNPLLAHSDKDGISDYQETKLNTQPLLLMLDKASADILFDDSYYYHAMLAQNYTDDEGGRTALQMNALIYGVVNQDAIYRDIIINYFLNYPPKEYLEQLTYDTQRDMTNGMLCKLLGDLEEVGKVYGTMGNATDEMGKVTSVVDYTIGVYELIDKLNENIDPSEYAKIMEEITEYLKKITDKFPEIKFELEIDGWSSKVKEVIGNVGDVEDIKGAYKQASLGVSIFASAIESATTIHSFATINANQKVFEQNILILEEIKNNSDIAAARAAAGDIQKQMGKQYGAVITEMMEPVLQGVGNYAIGELAGMTPFTTALLLVRDGMNLAGGISTDVKQAFEAMAYAELAKATTTVLKNSLKESGSVYVAKNSDAAYKSSVELNFVHLMNMRVLGEKKYLEVIRKDGLIFDWFDNDEDVAKHIQKTFNRLLEIAPYLNVPVY